MKTIQINLLFILLSLPSGALAQNAAYRVLIETSMGNLTCILYQETPMHAENFLTLINDKYYDGVLFHRVIKNFMIQTGDPDSKNAEKGEAVGYGGPEYLIPAEFHPGLYHRKGVMATARQGDQANPNRESNGSQFYIVQGKKLTDAELDQMEASGAHIRFTAEQRMVYKNLGGTPHLDYAYTVFGEVVDGFEVIDKIASLPTDERNRPLEDVKILNISILK